MKILSSISLAALLTVFSPGITAQAADPDFGPNVLIFDPGNKKIQAQTDPIAKTQSDEGKDQFNNNRYALLFKPGNYGDIDIPVGYYTQVLGLGQTPDAVTFTGKGPHSCHYGFVTQTFWRAVENLTVTNSSEYYWGVSQGAELRRVWVPGNKLSLFSGGYASGGFTADCKVAKEVGAGGQQQWFSRNSEFGHWSGGVWNLVFVGCPGINSSWPKPPFTAIDKTPVMAEKPYLYIDGAGNYFVNVPSVVANSSGVSWGKTDQKGVFTTMPTPGKSIPITQFYIAQVGKDSAASINAALASGKNLILTPGIYHLEDAIKITRADTIVLGLGYPTLIPDKGTPAMTVADVDGVRLAGAFLFEAGKTKSPTLLQIGDGTSSVSHAANPTIIYDVFARVGGGGPGATDCMVTINSNNVIGDNAWLWRADHGPGNGWNESQVKNALIVNGNDVIYYGLAVEHTQEYQTIWNGNGGRVYFYQSEMPYDVPQGTKAWASYKVGDKVTTHEGYGVGVYSFNHPGNPAVAENAFETPTAPGIKFFHLLLFKAGAGGIKHMINGVGPAGMSTGLQPMAQWPIAAQ